MVPLDAVLQRLNEEQVLKTKKLLSDLNSRRRSRQRKPIMVVGEPRLMLPKHNLMVVPHRQQQQQQQQQPQQQKLQPQQMLGGAVARQIVNFNNSFSPSPSYSNQNQPQSSSTNVVSSQLCFDAATNSSVGEARKRLENEANLSTRTLQQQQQHQLQFFMPNIQHTYSNLIPQILGNLLETNNSSCNTVGSSESSDAGEMINFEKQKHSTANAASADMTILASSMQQKQHQNIDDDNGNVDDRQKNKELLEEKSDSVSSPQNSALNEISLLDLSINNADSLFATAISLSAVNSNTNTGIASTVTTVALSAADSDVSVAADKPNQILSCVSDEFRPNSTTNSRIRPFAGLVTCSDSASNLEACGSLTDTDKPYGSEGDDGGGGAGDGVGHVCSTNDRDVIVQGAMGSIDDLNDNSTMTALSSKLLS
jgi:hypothetical protein